MEDTATTTTEQVQSVETQQVESTNVETPVTETQSTAVQEPVKPFELPVQENPISFDKPDDVLRAYKGDKKALLKELGFDDFILNAHDYYKATGNLADYAEVKSVDWNKVPVEKVAEEMLREQYSKTGLPEDKINRLVQRDLRNKYMLGDEYDSESEDTQLARIQMEADANLYRQQRIERQNQFKAPERTPEADVPTMSVEQLMEQQRQELLQDQGIQQFLQSKTVSFGDYKHGIENPNETIATIYDQNRWTYHLAQKTPDGKVVVKDGQPVMDRAKMLKVAAYVADMEGIEKALIAQGKAFGQKEVIDEAENVEERGSKGAATQEETFWQQWRKNATIK
jgi:hypothetical protein